MSTNNNSRYFRRAAVLMVAGLISIGQAAMAAGPNGEGSPPVPDQVLTPADQALSKDVSVLENRFFFHQYRHDPMEKRLERLELLTLGAAQGGSNADRLARLKQSVVERDKEAAKTIAKEAKGDGELAAKTNYPILGTLEWRMLKKTYPSEGIDQRLARMETQLFGMPAQAMSYIDRIDRLKKTVGMDVAVAAPPNRAGQYKGLGNNSIGLNGPLPRANRNGMGLQLPPQTGNRSGYLYDADGNVTGWYQNNSQSWSFPGSSNAVPNQAGGQNVFDAMDQMNRQMNEMMRHLSSPNFGGFGNFGSNGMPGVPGMPGMPSMPGMDDENTQSFGIQIGPDGIKTFGNHGQQLPNVQPGQPRQNQSKAAPKDMQATPPVKKFTAPKDDMPAYTDPNSI